MRVVEPEALLQATEELILRDKIEREEKSRKAKQNCNSVSDLTNTSISRLQSVEEE